MKPTETLEEKEHTTRLQLTAQPAPTGGFEILAISAGTGNGWEFPAAVLAESLPLWNGRECYLDHALLGHSVRDLAGVLHSAAWDEARQGITLRVRPLGPSAPLLVELGYAMLSGGDQPDAGFSADVIFTASGTRVEKILRVLSVDLVMKPARGGAFLRALNSRTFTTTISHGGERMTEENQKSQMNQTAADSGQTLASELEGARQIRRGMCAALLEGTLAAASLPEPAARALRARFAERIFDPAELQSAVEESRALVSELTGAAVVQGPGRISGMVTSEDQIQAALLDLLGAARPPELAGVKSARLSGIRELYTLLTGDYDFHGGYHPERMQLSTTASLPALLKNALNKLVLLGWEELGRSGYRWWEPVVSVEHFSSLQPLTGILVGEVNLLPSVAEGAAYTELAVEDSGETGEWGKYGGYVGLTLEMFERDETHRLRQYPRKLASAGLRRISYLVGQVFLANSGVGPAMADTYYVFDAAHHANLGTSALSSTTWEAASKAIYNQSMLVDSGATAPKLALDARYLLVPRDLRLTGQRILYPSFERESNIFSENLQKGQMGDVITVPEFTDANDWAAAADPLLAPAVIVAERFGLLPEIIIADSGTSAALFTNDEIRMKARHWVSVFVADYRPLFKANVA